MGEREQIDVTYDFRTDAGGKDPDQHSPILRTPVPARTPLARRAAEKGASAPVGPSKAL